MKSKYYKIYYQKNTEGLLVGVLTSGDFTVDYKAWGIVGEVQDLLLGVQVNEEKNFQPLRELIIQIF